MLPPSVNFAPKYLSKVKSWHHNLHFAYDLISELNPEIFVELGTHLGDSYFTFCQSRKENNLVTNCFAVDHWMGDDHSGKYDEHVFETVNVYNTQKYPSFSFLKRKSFEEALSDFDYNSIGLLHIDGHHAYESIKNDFSAWFPKVKNNGIILIHDTLEREKGFGVYKFWDEIKLNYPSFNLNFSHGLGVLRKTNSKNLNWVISPSFDYILKSKLYHKMKI